MTNEMVRVLILAVKHGWISEERYEELIDDYAIVPKEPTEAMLEEAYYVLPDEDIREAYKVMVKEAQENE